MAAALVLLAPPACNTVRVAMASVTIRARSFARGDILGMYKECLTLVRSFPSIKRDELYEDIRTGKHRRPAPPLHVSP